MKKALLLKMNESFVEMGSFQQEKLKYESWFSTSTPLKNKIEKSDSFQNVFLVTKLAQTIMQKSLGVSPAFLVTNGFENWLDMNIPVSEDFFTVHVSKPKSPISKDYIFAINERTQADGQILKQVDLDELDFLASKLMLNNIQNVAIGFLHSKTNPENEKIVGNFLKERGFHVYCSHECAHTDLDKNFVDSEKQRWWVAVLNAYIQPTWSEEMTLLENTLSEVANDKVNLKVANNNGLFDSWSTVFPLETIFAQEYLTLNYFKNQLPSKSKILGLYLGIEKFQLFEVFQEGHQMWRSELGPVAIRQPYFLDLFIQPTSIVEEGFWNNPYLSQKTSGYEPGPMCFGKSVKPTFLDSLYLEGHLQKVPEINAQLVEKSMKRISDTFFTYSKNSFSAELILKLGIQGIVSEVNKYPNNIVYCVGPLAPVLLPLFKNVASQKQFRIKDTDNCVLEELWLEVQR
ncbi:MAG: hypothetical protein H6625_10295 [Bdellovibrionaceae bacterium]|nr:hypothetical protein [Pseudobdellovibrionaceae bacterium]